MQSLALENLKLFAGVALVFALGCGGQSVVMPTSYALWNCKDGTFECEYPENWEAKGGGKRGPVWAKFASGPALISVKADLVGSLMGDLVGSITQGADQLPITLEPVHVIHVESQDAAATDFEGYTETAGPNVHDCPLGPARLSEFDYATSFGSKMCGYRATILGKDKRVTVFCTCPESDWKVLKPEFDKVLASFARGTAEL